MSLGGVRVSSEDARYIRDHISTHPLGYGNMHLRIRCKRDGEYDLRYLHIMHVDGSYIEGAISGRDIWWQYRIAPTGQVTVLIDRAPPRERRRIEKRFLPEVFARVEGEKKQLESGEKYTPRYARGQFYLRRSHYGTLPTHPTAVAAVTEGVFAQPFVDLLAPWGFELLRP